MQADFSVELGPDDETLTMPWAAPDGGPRYYDLKRHPEWISQIEEAQREPELASFLTALNSGALETAKCDAWFTPELNPEEDIFDASGKFGCYVDLLFSNDEDRFSFPRHEATAKRWVELLKRVPEIPASAEFLIRRCSFGEAAGFYFTLYVFGYGNDESQARRQWTIGLKLVENAIKQFSVLGRP